MPLFNAHFLKSDPPTGGFHHKMKRLGHPARHIPHPAEDGERDKLLGAEVPLHILEREVAFLRGHVRHFFRPADGGLLLGAEEIAFFPSIPVQNIELILRDALSPTELDVVPQSVVALR